VKTSFASKAFVLLAGLVLAPAAMAEPDRMLQPYGMSGAGYAEPYAPPSRDGNATRLVVNGRMVDLSGPKASPSSPAYGHSAGVGFSRTSSLRSSTLSMASIGNNVEISNVHGGTIIINQVNQGNQTSFAVGGRR